MEKMMETNRKFPVVIEKDEDGFLLISCPIFKGCHSYGSTIEEAIKNISEVIEICLEEDNSYNQTYIGVKEINLNNFEDNYINA